MARTSYRLTRQLAVAVALFLVPPAADAAIEQVVRLDGRAGGPPFSGFGIGIGIVEGSGGTGVLLKDYP